MYSLTKTTARPPARPGTKRPHLQRPGFGFAGRHQVMQDQVEAGNRVTIADHRGECVAQCCLDSGIAASLDRGGIRIDDARRSSGELSDTASEESTPPADIDDAGARVWQIAGQFGEVTHLVLDEQVVMKGFDLLS